MENSTREHQRYYIFVEWENGHPSKVGGAGDKALSLSQIKSSYKSFMAVMTYSIGD